MYRQNGKVVSYSTVKNESELPVIECELSNEDFKRMNNQHFLMVEDGQLKIEKKPEYVEKENKERLEKEIQEKKSKFIKEATEGKLKLNDVIEYLKTL